MPRTRDWDAMIGDTFDLLTDSPEGATLAEIAEILDVESVTARATVQRLREFLGDDSEVNVVVRNDGRSRRYCLAGSAVEEATEDGGQWLSFNQKYVNTRLATVRNVYASIYRGTRNERDADKCRRILKNLDRLIEDIQDVAE